MRNKNVKSQVKSILEKSIQARNSDRLLLTLIYLNYYPEYTMIKNGKVFVNILSTNAPLPESVRRARQWYQARGEYLASKDVKAYRRMKEDEFACDFKQSTKPKPLRKRLLSKIFKTKAFDFPALTSPKRCRIMELVQRKRMGAGVPRGLQIRLARVSGRGGGFDSHTLPPFLMYCQDG